MEQFVCPNNHEVDCESMTCERCGWYPPAAEKRKEEIMKLRKYVIPFTGYCEVWAKSPEEATAKAENIEQQFFAHYDYGEPICKEKEDENELD